MLLTLTTTHQPATDLGYLLTNYTFTATNNQTLIANFTTNFYSVSTTSSPSGTGTTVGDTNTAFGTSVTVTAAATNAGYGFAGWMDDSSNVVSTSLSYNPDESGLYH